MLSYLLDEAANTAGTGDDWTQYTMWILVGIIIVAFVVWMVISSKKRKKQEQEAKDLIDAVKPGNKVKTIGGVCGIVVEVNSEENTFVLETGSEAVGKSYVKFDKQAIYQTDAVVEKESSKTIKEEAPVEQVVEEAKPAENTEAVENKKASEEGPVLVKAKKEKKAKEQTEENND